MGQEVKSVWESRRSGNVYDKKDGLPEKVQRKLDKNK